MVTWRLCGLDQETVRPMLLTSLVNFQASCEIQIKHHLYKLFPTLLYKLFPISFLTPAPSGWNWLFKKILVHSVALSIVSRLSLYLLFVYMVPSLYGHLRCLKAGKVFPLVLYSGEPAQCLALTQCWMKLQCVNDLAELSWLVSNGVQMKV